jgi:hypothetical protein
MNNYLPVESYIIQRLESGGWGVIERRKDLKDIPIADFVSHRDAEEWAKWKQGLPKLNPYAKWSFGHRLNLERARELPSGVHQPSGISPNVFPAGIGFNRISRESSTAA